jgi:hypothetical protein
MGKSIATVRRLVGLDAVLVNVVVAPNLQSIRSFYSPVQEAQLETCYFHQDAIRVPLGCIKPRSNGSRRGGVVSTLRRS